MILWECHEIRIIRYLHPHYIRSFFVLTSGDQMVLLQATPTTRPIRVLLISNTVTPEDGMKEYSATTIKGHVPPDSHNYTYEGSTMRNFLSTVSVFLVVIWFSTPAHSGDGVYLGASVGIGDTDGFNLEIGNVSLPTELGRGTALAFAVGYDLGTARVEGELAYQKNRFDRINLPGLELDLAGDATGVFLLANGYYDFHNKTVFTPYVSAGIGFASIGASDFNVSGSGVPNQDESSSVLAYQVSMGLGYAATERLTVDVRYRYLATSDPKWSGVEAEYSCHNFLLGLRIVF